MSTVKTAWQREHPNQTRNTARYRARKRAKGECYIGGCHENAVGRMFCLKHLLLNRESERRRNRARSRARICHFPNCSSVTGELYTRFCPEHRDYKARRRLLSICYFCSKDAVPFHTLCEFHRAKSAEKALLYYRKRRQERRIQ